MTLAVAPVHYYNAIRADSTTLEYVIFDTLHSCFGIAALGTTRSAIDNDVRDRLWLFSQLALKIIKPPPSHPPSGHYQTPLSYALQRLQMGADCYDSPSCKTDSDCDPSL
jgi:hypothetical protein